MELLESSDSGSSVYGGSSPPVRTCPSHHPCPIIYRVVEKADPPDGSPSNATDDAEPDPGDTGSAVRDGLRGKRVLITGVTGFLGTALFERLLGDFSQTEILLLVRPKHGSTGLARIDELLGGAAFRPLRDREGLESLRQAVADRVTVVDGDVTVDVPDLPSDLDVVFHCAASVSFDPPIDQAFETNVLGTTRLYEAVARSAGRPHLVHVSTAYVAGSRKGIIPEATLSHGVDWRTEA